MLFRIAILVSLCAWAALGDVTPPGQACPADTWEPLGATYFLNQYSGHLAEWSSLSFPAVRMGEPFAALTATVQTQGNGYWYIAQLGWDNNVTYAMINCLSPLVNLTQGVDGGCIAALQAGMTRSGIIVHPNVSPAGTLIQTLWVIDDHGYLLQQSAYGPVYAVTARAFYHYNDSSFTGSVSSIGGGSEAYVRYITNGRLLFSHPYDTPCLDNTCLANSYAPLVVKALSQRSLSGNDLDTNVATIWNVMHSYTPVSRMASLYWAQPISGNMYGLVQCANDIEVNTEPCKTQLTLGVTWIAFERDEFKYGDGALHYFALTSTGVRTSTTQVGASAPIPLTARIWFRQRYGWTPTIADWVSQTTIHMYANSDNPSAVVSANTPLTEPCTPMSPASPVSAAGRVAAGTLAGLLALVAVVAML